MKHSNFTSRVLCVVRSIPVGRVATYGDVAKLAGRPLAARAIGNIMRNCSDQSVPCHRVIAAGGQLGGFRNSLWIKHSLHLAERLSVSRGRLHNFSSVRWDGKNSHDTTEPV